jgi:hypothetical protein
MNMFVGGGFKPPLHINIKMKGFLCLPMAHLKEVLALIPV